MSQEAQDQLEEALRGDLPSPETEARLKRRLLAAGLAVGHGVASGTAAGAGAAGGLTSGAGMAAAAAGATPWAVKLGVLALLAAPAAGLLIRHDRQPAAPAVAASQTATAARVATPSEPLPSETQAAPAAIASATAKPRTPPAARSQRPAEEERTASALAPAAALPAQAAFAAEATSSGVSRGQSTLAEETRLLDAAFAALAAGERTRARALLAEHEARYPAGLLERERERAKRRLLELSRGE